ncbi:MAG: ASKHA domain-containing protein [Lachnospiraceae bacterium]|nr:ASKHA domain-containing protein [Lachnospiraceae bacterium]
MVQVFFVREGKKICIPEGTTVLEAEIQAGLKPDAPCGGAGRCGKCLVRIAGESSDGNADTPPVRACQTKVTSDILVDTMISHKKEFSILTEGYLRPVTYHPGLLVHKIQLDKPKPGDKRSDWERMLSQLAKEEPAALPAMQPQIRPEMQQETQLEMQPEIEPDSQSDMQMAETSGIQPDRALASTLYERREETAVWYAIHTEDEILDLRREAGRVCFAAFDIGTTTVVGYLLDAEDGRTLAVESCLNPQTQYGADVIMRANYALEHGTEILAACIRTAINEMLKKLARKAQISTEDIFQVSLVGNTCMHHLFLGISPASLVHAPYTPAISRRMTLRAADYGLDIHPKAQLLMLPVIAGYVGADTCACLMAVRPDQKEEITLLLDIGTNGEMVLGNRKRRVACSTAAGPAFEGAKITCGMRGAAGAVDHVFYEDGVWSYSTIGGEPAVGLCGSGLIDLTACLLRAGKIDENGRLESGQEDPQTFVLVPPEDSGNGKGVYLTRKDVGEVQLAKAAIAAGIQLLMEELGVTEEDISEVCIAGAFGSYMNPISAGEIGMFPRSLTDRVSAIGNAAGEGAKLALISLEELKMADELADGTDFIELAALPEFQDCFIEQLGFENAGD